MRGLWTLLRWPLPLSCIADVWLGAALAGCAVPAGLSQPRLLVGITASMLLYCGGLILNDVADREEDADRYPQRPIPSGAISARRAAWIGGGLLTTAVLGTTALGTAPGLGALAIAGAVLLYDLLLKRIQLPGALVMGSARGLNVCLGALLVTGAQPAPPVLLAAALVTAYITLVTLISWREDYPDAWGAPLVVAAALVLVGAGRGDPLATVIALAGITLWLPALKRWRQEAGEPSRTTIGMQVGAMLGALPVLEAVILTATGHPTAAVVCLGVLLVIRSFRRMQARAAR